MRAAMPLGGEPVCQTTAAPEFSPAHTSRSHPHRIVELLRKDEELFYEADLRHMHQ